MLAILSPAKSLDYETPLPPVATTRPRFAGEAKRIAGAAAKLGPDRLAELMDISDKLAVLNDQRYRRFARAPLRPAIYAFNGDVYIGMEAATLDEPAIAYAQDHVRILSGLYGLLRPLDTIRPYRLEMGTRWAPEAASLYAHWGNRVSTALAADLRSEGSGVIVNLASKEYWQVIAQAPPKKARVVTFDFREHAPDGLRFNSFAAKRARGMAARYICEHRIERVEDLQGFDSDGYRFDPSSEGDLWRFIRG
jgi:cytoplasmic iron level regulating protein YaaA (DUF328/UPF0246 family)